VPRSYQHTAGDSADNPASTDESLAGHRFFLAEAFACVPRDT
jgi:hypothetical protein